MPNLFEVHKNILQQSASVHADTRTWTPISNQNLPNHFSAPRRTRSISLSKNLAISSSLYGRILDAYVDFVVPRDMYLAISPDFPPEYKQQLDWIWNTGPSALAPAARDLIQTLFIEGELLLIPRINDADGRITITNENPDSIEEIFKGEGLNVVSKIVINTSGIHGDNNNKTYDVIRSDALGILSGDIFYFRVMPAGYTAGMRGLPLMVRGLDDIASSTELIYNYITRLSRFATHYWDVTLTGATQEKIDDFMSSEYSVPPESGEVFAHNESAIWQLISQNISRISDDAEYFINLVIGGSGLTPEFIGHTISRDMTTESLFSAFMRLENLQAGVRTIFETILRFAIINAKTVGANKKINDTNDAVTIIVKEAGSRLTQRQSLSLRNFVTSLETANNANLIDNADAKDILNELLLRYNLLSKNKGFVPFDMKTNNGIQESRII